MISFRVRFLAGVSAAVLCVFACWIAVQTRRPIAVVLFAPAALLAMPLFAARRPPCLEDWPMLDENVSRFRTAGLICFSLAVLAHTATLALRLGSEAMERVAALGVAWWAVGFGLIPFALYFASRRAMLEDDSIE
jgi:hypothetical protein